MIPESLLEILPLYVLGELDESERATFEVHLSRSPELQQEVRNCADTFAMLAVDPGARRSLPAHLWAGVEQRLAFSAAGVAPAAFPAPAPGSPHEVPASWLRWAWPAAAALFFALNLAQWFWPSAGEVAPGDRGVVASDDGTGPSGLAGGGGGERPGNGGDVRTVRSDNMDTAAGSDRGRIAPALAADDAIEARAREHGLAKDYRRLSGDYEALANAVVHLVEAGLFDPSQTGNQALELRSRSTGVDAGTSVGLWDRARELVSDGGLALVPDRWRLGSTGFDPGVTGDPGAGGQAAPFAMAVLNPGRGLGYLDLYNLPLLPADGSMQLWLQNAEGGGYTSVGEVPPVLAGGAGGLVFRIPAEAEGPIRVIVTIERGPVPAQPTGPVVIEGP